MGKKFIKKIIPEFILKFYHFLWALFSCILYRQPSQDMIVIGVTGTNGKSTTVKLISSILKEDGKKVATISSANFEIAGDQWKNSRKITMPGRGFIQKFLKKAKTKDCDVAVVEVTSEGIVQFRHRFIDFDIGVFTNLAPEHIEAHGSFEAYKKAKGKFFEAVDKTHILNLDDEHFDYFQTFTSERKCGYGFKRTSDKLSETYNGKELQSTQDGISFELRDEKITMSLMGQFNGYNGLAAISVAQELDVDLNTCKNALAEFSGMPGRMEEIQFDEFTVIVDYAFTPNALEQVYDDAKSKYDPNNLIAILGSCGGGRDKWKRPVLGEIAADFADKVIVTNEDPYDEEPMDIIEEVAEGTEDKAEKILSRREAINEALSAAQEGDIIIITGKGSESWIQVENGKKIPWNERKVIKEEYQKIYEG